MKEKGVWRTIKGRHIFIKEGQSLREALSKDANKKDVDNKRKQRDYNNKLDKIEDDNDYALYKKAKENEDSIDPMTEWSTNWEELDKKYARRYYKEKGYSDSDIDNTLMYKTKEDRMKENGVKFSDTNKLRLQKEYHNPREEVKYYLQKGEFNKAREAMKDYGLEDEEEEFISNLNDNARLDYKASKKGYSIAYSGNSTGDKNYPQLMRNGITYNVVEHIDGEGYHNEISATGKKIVMKNTERYRIENPNDKSDWGWIEKEEYKKLTNNNEEKVIPDKLLTEATNEWKNPERQKQYIEQQLKLKKAELKALEEHNASNPSTLSYMGNLKGYIKKYEDKVDNKTLDKVITKIGDNKVRLKYKTEQEYVQYLLSRGYKEETARRMARYLVTKFEKRKNKFGKEQYDKYGDAILKRYGGMQISKRIEDADKPGGLKTVAKEIGASDEYEVVRALEGMVRNKKANTPDDSSYNIAGTYNIGENELKKYAEQYKQKQERINERHRKSKEFNELIYMYTQKGYSEMTARKMARMYLKNRKNK